MHRLAILFLVLAVLVAFFGSEGFASYSWAGAFLVLAVLCYLGTRASKAGRETNRMRG
jgi:hypothetical protein